MSGVIFAGCGISLATIPRRMQSVIKRALSILMFMDVRGLAQIFKGLGASIWDDFNDTIRAGCKYLSRLIRSNFLDSRNATYEYLTFISEKSSYE